MRFASLTTLSLNLGDEIQRLAADRFLPRVDFTIDRERLHEAAELPNSFYISNGWFMHQPARFPPPPNLNPFYISFHAATTSLFSTEAITHFRKFAPIGCRDRHTLTLFRERNIPAYFSGCLTWTLPRPDVPRTDEVLLVDVPKSFYRFLPAKIRPRAQSVTHWCCVGTTWDYLVMPVVSVDGAQTTLLRGVSRVDRSVRRFLSGAAVSAREDAMNIRLGCARSLVEKYSRAALVITPRIHSCFPCLALKTPVILLQPRSVFAPERYSVDVPFVRPWREAEYDRIDWAPAGADLSPCRRFLEVLCEEAVRLQDNPLRYRPIEDYYEQSRWNSDGVK